MAPLHGGYTHILFLFHHGILSRLQRPFKFSTWWNTIYSLQQQLQWTRTDSLFLYWWCHRHATIRLHICWRLSSKEWLIAFWCCHQNVKYFTAWLNSKRHSRIPSACMHPWNPLNIIMSLLWSTCLKIFLHTAMQLNMAVGQWLISRTRCGLLLIYVSYSQLLTQSK